MTAIPEALRGAIASGEFESLASLYAEEALLDASVQGRRVRWRRREEIVAELERIYPAPGRILEWDAREFPRGLALWVERPGDDGSGCNGSARFAGRLCSTRPAGRARGSNRPLSRTAGGWF